MALEDGRTVTITSSASATEKLLLHHKEKHFTAGDVVRDVIMGVSDGLTVPFALAAGLSGASAPSYLILTAGLAEVAAGAISMGLGGYFLSTPFPKSHCESLVSGEVILSLGTSLGPVQKWKDRQKKKREDQINGRRLTFCFQISPGTIFWW